MPNLKIFVISLKHAKLRREKIQTALTEAGADFDFFRASDGCALSEDEKMLALSLNPKIIVGKKGRKMRKLATIYPQLLPGEVGCYLSHYRLLQKIVAEK